MTTYFLVGLALLVALCALVIALAARHVSKIATADIYRLNQIDKYKLTVCRDPEAVSGQWGVLHKGKLVHIHPNLRAALDVAITNVITEEFAHG